MGVFDFTLEVGQPSDSHFQLIKVLNPTIELWVVPDCPVCAVVRDYFESEPGVTLKLRTTGVRGAEPAAAKSAARTRDYPLAQYRWNRELYPVPLPKLHDGAPSATLHRRLKSAFVQQPRRLREHQKDLHRAFEKRSMQERNTPAFTVVWEMGSGKTLGATSLMINHRSRYNMVVATNTNLGYWVSHIRETPFITREAVAAAMKQQQHPRRKPPAAGAEAEAAAEASEIDAGVEVQSVVSRFAAKERDVVLWFDVIGYTAFRNDYDNPKALKSYDCVVLDEAHYFRNNTQGMQSAIHAIHSARNVVLLTGTPLVNDVEDLVGMLQLTDMDRTRDWEREYLKSGRLPTPAEVTAFLGGHVSWFDPQVHRPNMFKKFYPSMVDRVVKVPMTWSQTLEYLMGERSVFEFGPYSIQQGKSNRYNCLTRAVCNAPGNDPQSSPKLQLVAATIAKHVPEGPQVVHSSLIDTGVKPLKRMCDADKVRYGSMEIITGTTDNAVRDAARARYNRGKTNVLFISDAMQFGLDLQATRVIHLTEPHQNRSTENQTTARAIRMGSHTKCAYKEVIRYKYLSTFPTAKMTPAETEALKREMIAQKVFMRDTAEILKEVDLADELWKKVKKAGETINEKQERDNTRKHSEILPYNTAYQRASVTMSKQKGAKLFEDDPDEEPAAGAGAKPKRVGKKTVGCQTVLRGKDLDALSAVTEKRLAAAAGRRKASQPVPRKPGERFTYKVTAKIPAL